MLLLARLSLKQGMNYVKIKVKIPKLVNQNFKKVQKVSVVQTILLSLHASRNGSRCN